MCLILVDVIWFSSLKIEAIKRDVELRVTFFMNGFKEHICVQKKERNAKFTLQEATKAQRRNRGIDLLFL
jgi:hypothetical protein